MASCSVWLFVHLSSSFSFCLVIMSLPLKITTPDPTHFWNLLMICDIRDMIDMIYDWSDMIYDWYDMTRYGTIRYDIW
jgi:hypothetical protein